MTDLLEALDTFYFSLKLRYGAAARTRETVLGEQQQLPLLPELTRWLDGQPPQPPAVEIYRLNSADVGVGGFEVVTFPIGEAVVAVLVRADAVAVCIAGGHVASMLNRFDLFGIADLLDGQALFGWSAGAMVLTERIVLFHDSPPQGPGAAEVMDHGLGLVPGVVALPSPEDRLRLDDTERVSVLAGRFAPARCLALPGGSHVTYKDGALTHAKDVQELQADGSVTAFEGGDVVSLADATSVDDAQDRGAA